MTTPGPGLGLLGRRSECAALDDLVASVRAGPSRALVLRGEVGVGKSALLEYLTRSVSGCALARAVLSLLSEVAEDRPLIAIVDDAKCSTRRRRSGGLRGTSSGGESVALATVPL